MTRQCACFGLKISRTILKKPIKSQYKERIRFDNNNGYFTDFTNKVYASESFKITINYLMTAQFKTFSITLQSSAGKYNFPEQMNNSNPTVFKVHLTLITESKIEAQLPHIELAIRSLKSCKF